MLREIQKGDIQKYSKARFRSAQDRWYYLGIWAFEEGVILFYVKNDITHVFINS